MATLTKNEILQLSIPSRREVISGVYFLIYKEEIVYIGSAFDVLSRINMHKKSKAFMFNRMHIIKCDGKDKSERWAIEKHYIMLYKPVKNKTYLNHSNPLQLTKYDNYENRKYIREQS